MYVQRRQLERARAELGIGKRQYHSSGFFPMDASLNHIGEMEFYKFHFPFTDEVNLSPSGPTLAYYRLLKAGNTQTRAMLFDLAHRLGLVDTPLTSCACIDDCITNASHVFQPKPGVVGGEGDEGVRRIPFTFVRDPLTRFVLGYREIIERFPVWDPTVLEQHSYPSTSACFAEFVRLLLLANMGRLMDRFPAVKLDHIAPATGILLQAKERGDRMIIYKALVARGLCFETQKSRTGAEIAASLCVVLDRPTSLYGHRSVPSEA